MLLKGAVADHLMHLKGPAKVYNSEEDVTKAYLTMKSEGDIVVISEGPKRTVCVKCSI